jgi:LysM repeat protein|tara:strand:+ start:264 stop:1268 length:1005 start_codon:yes stop_codon:yes gene_type:complete
LERAIDMPALIAGANALASVPRLASRRGIRTDAVPAVAPTPDRVACRVVFGARKHRGRFLAFAGRDVTTRVAPVTGYVSTPEFWTHITKPGENLNFIGMDYGVSVDALRQANGLRHATGDVIYESQEIRVPVTDANRGKIELIHAKAIVAAEQAASTLAAAQRGDGNKNKGNQKQAAAKKEKEANGAKSLGADKSSQTFTNDANATWRAPYRLMRPREVTALTRADVEQMMPGAHGPVPPGLEHLQGLRDVDVMLLVETPECEWCAKLRPTWRQLAETTGPNTRVCVFTTTSQTDKAWADTYLAANAFPTVIAMPTKGKYWAFPKSHDCLRIQD